MWSAGPVQFYPCTFLERMAGLYRFFLFSGSVVAGTVEMARGVVRVSFHFLQSAVSTFGCRISVVGFLCYISIFFGGFVVFSRGFVFFQAGNFLNSLQVVQAESELGGPGTSA